MPFQTNITQKLMLIDMSKGKHPFVFNYGNELNNFEYLGSDGLPIAETYDLYLVKCEEFKNNARKYARDNLHTKTSVLHQSKYGYESSEQLDEEVLMEREDLMKDYETTFDITLFDKNPNAIYECFSGKSKSIRVIRELYQGRNEDLSDDFYKKRDNWFTRYCILSRFIEAARKIILLRRLEKTLVKLKTLTPNFINQIELGKEYIEEEKKEFENAVQEV